MGGKATAGREPLSRRHGPRPAPRGTSRRGRRSGCRRPEPPQASFSLLNRKSGDERAPGFARLRDNVWALGRCLCDSGGKRFPPVTAAKRRLEGRPGARPRASLVFESEGKKRLPREGSPEDPARAGHVSAPGGGGAGGSRAAGGGDADPARGGSPAVTAFGACLVSPWSDPRFFPGRLAHVPRGPF